MKNECTSKKWYNLTNSNKTQPRSEFLNWIRYQSKLASDKTHGFVVSDIDTMIFNYVSDKIGYFELKSNNAPIKFAQQQGLCKQHRLMDGEEDYVGTYLIQFENDSPEDGKTTVSKCDGKSFNKYKEFNSGEEVVNWITELFMVDEIIQRNERIKVRCTEEAKKIWEDIKTRYEEREKKENLS